MTCPKCGSSKIRSRGTGTTDCTGRVTISGMEYECENCWWNWSKGEDARLTRDAQEEKDRRDRIWDHAERTGIFDELKKQWEGKGKEDRPCPPVYPFGPGRANPSPYAFPRQWNDGGTTGTPPDQWYVRW